MVDHQCRCPSTIFIVGACQGRERERDKERERERESTRRPRRCPPHTRHASCPHLRSARCSRTLTSFASSARTSSLTNAGGRGSVEGEMRGILSGTGIKYYEELRTLTSTTRCPTSTRSLHNEIILHRQYQASWRPIHARHILILVFSQGRSREVFPLAERRRRVEMRITPDATTATITRTIAPTHHAWTIWHMGRRLAALIRVVGRCSGRRIRRQECERKGVSGPAVAAEHHHRGRGTTHYALPALIRPLEGRTGHGGRVDDGGDVSHVHPVCNVFGSS